MVLDAMKSQAEMYASQFNGEPYLSQAEITNNITGQAATEEQVYEAADHLMDFYDNLLGQNTEDLREEFKEDILYDMSIAEILKPRVDKQSAKIFGSGLIGPAAISILDPSMLGEVATATALICGAKNAKTTALNAEAGYNPLSKKIGVSRGTLPEKEAYDTLASELVHRYQHEFHSETWTDAREVEGEPPITQGVERAIKIKALEDFAEQELQDLEWEELYAQRAASTAINGYAQALSNTSQIGEEEMMEIGLSNEKATEAVENVGSNESEGYDLVASSLMAQENISGDDIYEEVFEGDFTLIPDFASSQ